MNDLPFETLLKANDSKDRWYPTPIDTLKYSVKIDMSIENARALHSNIAYNLQYIEFLEKELEELNLSSVVYIMVVKNYVIIVVYYTHIKSHIMAYYVFKYIKRAFA